MRRFICLLAALCLLAGCSPAAPPAVSEDWAGPESVHLPVLMYHHIADEDTSSTVISEAGFRRQMDVLAENGYTPVSLPDLLAYAAGTGTLPEKPVVITFDDGYMSTWERAFPILGEYGFPAAVFAIGCSVGHTEFYKDTDHAMTPHFGTAEIEEMLASGRMAVQSHSYDMHQWAPFEDTDAPRTDMLPLEGESEADYAAALEADFQREAETLAAGGVESVYALAFPLGRHIGVTDRVLRDLGVQITFTVDESRVNTVTRGDPDSLYGLGRKNMSDGVTDEELLTYLAQ